MDENVFKASLQSGPRVGDLDTDRVLMDRLLQVQENLHTVVLQLKEKTLGQALETANNIVAGTPGQAEQALKNTRDLGNDLNEALQDSLNTNKRSIKDLFDEHFRHLGGFLNESGKFLDDFVSSHQKDVQKLFSSYSGGLGGVAAEALHVKDSQGKQLISNVAVGALGAAESLGALIPSLAGLSGSVAAFIGSLAAATVALGAFSAFSSLKDQEKFNAGLLKGAPLAADHLFETQGTSLNQKRLDLNSVLAGDRSKEELDKLYQAAFETRPGGATNFQQMDNLAATFGMLEDRGLSVDRSKSFATTMRSELNMSYGQTIASMMELSTTAITHRYDIGTYMEKIVQLTKSVKNQGLTISDVNRVVQSWAGTTLANGMVLTPDDAMSAAQMQLNMRRSLSEGEAAYVIMNNPDLKAKSGEGLYGSSRSLGDLANLGPLGLKQAALQLRIGNVSGGQGAVSRYHNEMVDRLMAAIGADSSGLNQNEMKNLRYTMMASELGVDEKYGIDAGVTAFVQKLANKELLSEDEFKKQMYEVTAKPIDKLYDELKNRYPTLLNKMYEHQKDHKNMLLSWQQIWVDIQNMLGSAFLPMVEVIASGVSSLGTYVMTGDVWKAGSQFQTMQSLFLRENQSAFRNVFEGRSDIAEALGLWPSSPEHMSAGGKTHKIMEDAVRLFSGARGSDADKYLPDIVRSAKEFEIDPAFLMGLIDAESGFNPDAKSHAGALGLGQLMKPAMMDVKRRYGYTVDPLNPQSNIRGTAMYLRMKLEEYTNKGYDKQTAIKLALMAYNGGSGRVNQFIAEGGDLDDLPAETRLYPGKVLAATSGWRNRKMKELGDSASIGSKWSPDIPKFNVEAISTIDIHLHDPNTKSKFQGRKVNKKSLNYGVGR